MSPSAQSSEDVNFLSEDCIYIGCPLKLIGQLWCEGIDCRTFVKNINYGDKMAYLNSSPLTSQQRIIINFKVLMSLNFHRLGL